MSRKQLSKINVEDQPEMKVHAGFHSDFCHFSPQRSLVPEGYADQNSKKSGVSALFIGPPKTPYEVV